MKCGDCGQDILQAHPEMCPYCRSKNLISEEQASKEIKAIEQLEKAGRYEDAALRYEKLELWDKARQCRNAARKKGKTRATSKTGKIGTINLVCPQCGESQPLSSKTAELICGRCGTTYLVPEQALELMK
jgi:ribosomal protein S27AE